MDENAQLGRFLSAKEAAEELQISISTLYAYVSRGLIRSESTGDRSVRTKRYHREDVERLKARKELRKEPSKVTENALNWGAPVMESSITMISDNQLYYRGKSVIQLSETEEIEDVARLLWECPLSREELFDEKGIALPSRWHEIADSVKNLPTIQKLLLLLPLAESEDVASWDLSPLRVMRTGSDIVRMIVSVIVERNIGGERIASALANRWHDTPGDISQLLNAALILCADHELNVSSFTARCVASAGSNPWAVVMAGLSALKGSKHGGHTKKVEGLLREIGTESEVGYILSERLQRGEQIPGFGHHLYPEGDPRGRKLLDMVYSYFPESSTTMLIRHLESEVQRHIGLQPTIDLPLVALARNLKLPSDGAVILFALGRTIGWIGHAIEQYRVGKMIRPRARYIGRLPESSEDK